MTDWRRVSSSTGPRGHFQRDSEPHLRYKLDAAKRTEHSLGAALLELVRTATATTGAPLLVRRRALKQIRGAVMRYDRARETTRRAEREWLRACASTLQRTATAVWYTSRRRRLKSVHVAVGQRLKKLSGR